MLPTPPQKDSKRWLELGNLLRRQYVELAADGLDFRSVADRVESVGGKEELQRWHDLAHLQDDYHRTLDELALWDRQTARLKAIEFHECTTNRDIVLLGTVDMNVALRQMLDQVANRVTSLVVAPDTWHERFDDHGCLIPDRWQDLQLNLGDDQIEVVDRPRDQAAAVVRQLASYQGRYGGDEITIGVPNQQLIPEIERQLQLASVAGRWGPGQSLREAGPYRLLTAVAEFVVHQRFSDFAGLVRHADIENWLIAGGLQGDWLSELDRYQADHLPYHVPNSWLGAPEQTAKIRSVNDLLNQLLSPLVGQERPLGDWHEPLTGLLLTVYKHRQFDRADLADRMTLTCCQRLVEAFDEQAAVLPGVAITVQNINTGLTRVTATSGEATSASARYHPAATR